MLCAAVWWTRHDWTPSPLLHWKFARSMLSVLANRACWGWSCCDARKTSTRLHLPCRCTFWSAAYWCWVCETVGWCTWWSALAISVEVNHLPVAVHAHYPPRLMLQIWRSWTWFKTFFHSFTSLHNTNDEICCQQVLGAQVQVPSSVGHIWKLSIDSILLSDMFDSSFRRTQIEPLINWGRRASWPHHNCGDNLVSM